MSLVLVSQQSPSLRLERWIQSRGWTVHEQSVLLGGRAHLLIAGPPILKTIATAGGHERRLIGKGTFRVSRQWGAAALDAILMENDPSFPWNLLKGHFNVIHLQPNRVDVITDQNGFLPIYESTSLNHGRTISTSLTATALQTGQLTLAHQEMYERVLTQSSYGNKTIFKEIRKLNAGTVVDFISGETSSYIERHVEPRTPESILEPISQYFSNFDNYTERLGCDLSAGYDSRTVASLLLGSKANFHFCTNDNPSDPLDHTVPQRIARDFQKEILIVTENSSQRDEPEFYEESQKFHGFYRNAFDGAIAKKYFEQKGRHFDLLLGGYGGELLRDPYLQCKSRPGFLRNFYSHRLDIDRMAPGFIEILLKKWDSSLIPGANEYESFYYAERMRHWGGERVELASTEYGYMHPFMDWELMKYILGIPPAFKQGAWLQKWLMKKIFPEICGYTSSYGFNFEPESDPPICYSPKRSLKQRVLDITPWSVQETWRTWKKNPPPSFATEMHKAPPKILPDYLPWNLGRLERSGRWALSSQYYSLDQALLSLYEQGVSFR